MPKKDLYRNATLPQIQGLIFNTDLSKYDGGKITPEDVARLDKEAKRLDDKGVRIIPQFPLGKGRPS